ncbi:hypothetical protein SAMN05444483_10978 [Salegentibacter echinorum]|uniref:Uncharacterized protein n=1 Tax=Salegentibacter echinorum TaxID=1073325 RepID=A0A1M5J1J9_SALEC|nr:hypothetical protein [Salegentibacter echinorum]SHG34467.1 hypothetical protein SAMN05444483_10978 [Salegentibacter echinorum]
MVNWEKLLAIINSPENDGRDYGPLIREILGSLSIETLIKLLSIAEKENLKTLKPRLIKEIEKRSSDFPKS